MCKTWGRIRIRIGIKTKTMPIHNNGFESQFSRITDMFEGVLEPLHAGSLAKQVPMIAYITSDTYVTVRIPAD